VHAISGQLAFLAGAYGGEILVYRVSPAGADLVAIDPDTRGVRPLAELPPYARDFSVSDAGELVFQERHETDASAWVIDRLDLTTGQRTRLITSPSHGLAPHAWPGGGLAYTPDRRTGMALMGAAASLRGPLGPGVDVVQAVSPGGSWVAVLHTSPSALAIPFVVHAATGQIAAIPAPPGARVAIAGFAPAAGGGTP
jgi:hypothetical protein